MGGFDLGLIEAQACPPAAAAGGAHGAGGAGAGVDTSAAVAAGVGTTCEISHKRKHVRLLVRMVMLVYRTT